LKDDQLINHDHGGGYGLAIRQLPTNYKHILMMRTLKLALIALVAFFVSTPIVANATTAKQYHQQLVPYSLNYLRTHQPKINVNKKNFNDAWVRIQCAQLSNTNFIYWTVSFDGTGGSYSFDTSSYGWTPPDHSYQWWGVAPGTYTVTLHNQSYSQGYYFDSNISYVVNDQSAGDVVYDTNTDNNDIVFHNVEVTGESFIELWVGPHS
jgi:hypothetical protein